MRPTIVLAKAASAGGIGSGAALGLLVLTEAGLPIPVPGDLLMIFLGERASAGALPLWGAVLAAEAVAFVGLALLFILVRGPAAVTLRRVGPRAGLTPERLARVHGAVERRGPRVIAVGRATPGLRTLTVVAGASCGLSARRVLAALLIGSTVFVQGHVLLGFALGAAARDVFDRARVPVIIVIAAAVLAGLGLWIVRRGRRGGTQSWSEASCPACLVVGIFGHDPAERRA